MSFYSVSRSFCTTNVSSSTIDIYIYIYIGRPLVTIHLGSLFSSKPRSKEQKKCHTPANSEATVAMANSQAAMQPAIQPAHEPGVGHGPKDF